MIHGQTRRTAAQVGLLDRGLVAPGYKADLNVIDFDRLTLRAPQIVFDLPAGGKRLVQRTEGYEVTVKAGRVAFREGEPVIDDPSRLPGRLVRGAQPEPGR